MRKHTNTEKQNGELAMRALSPKARKVYNGVDPLTVWERTEDVFDDDGNVVDSYRVYDVQVAGHYQEGLTFEELQEYFEDIQDALDEIDTEEEND